MLVSLDTGLCIYGDADYVDNFPWIRSALQHNQMYKGMQCQMDCNMLSQYIMSEWGFGKVIKYVY